MIDMVLFPTLAISLYTDLTRRRIYNWTTIPAMFLGLILNTWENGLGGFKQALLGWAVGLFIFFIPFLFGGISGGDIKLLAAIGALKGVNFILEAVLLTALAGGIYILVYVIVTRQFWVIIKNLKNTLLLIIMSISARSLPCILKWDEGQARNVPTCGTMPYGVAIFAGTLLTFVLG